MWENASHPSHAAHAGRYFLAARRHLAAAPSMTGRREDQQCQQGEKLSMGEVMQQVAFVDEAVSAAAMIPLMQHRIRGALNAAGFGNTGRKFSVTRRRSGVGLWGS